MTPIRKLAACLCLAGLAGCEAAPTAARTPTEARRDVNQAPVAVVTWTRHVITGGMRYSLNGTGSYDPDGTIVSYFWANNCWPQPESIQTTTTIDVATGDTCSVTLEVWDNEDGFGSQEVVLN